MRRKQQRSKSVAQLPRKKDSCAQYCDQNIEWAHLAKEAIAYELKEADKKTQNSLKNKSAQPDFKALCFLIKKINVLLKKNVEGSERRMKDQVEFCQRIHRLLKEPGQKTSYEDGMNVMDYFLSTLQDRENMIEYYEGIIERYKQYGGYEKYEQEIVAKNQELLKLRQQNEQKCINERNKLDKMISEYDKGKKTLESLNKELYAKQIKLRKLEKDRERADRNKKNS